MAVFTGKSEADGRPDIRLQNYESIDRLDSQRLFPKVRVSITRVHRFKMRGTQFKGDVQGKVFTHGLVGSWNSLPDEVAH